MGNIKLKGSVCMCVFVCAGMCVCVRMGKLADRGSLPAPE